MVPPATECLFTKTIHRQSCSASKKIVIFTPSLRSLLMLAFGSIQAAGYHVTIIKDAFAAFSHEGLHSGNEVDGPAFAHAILTAKELLSHLPTEQG